MYYISDENVVMENRLNLVKYRVFNPLFLNGLAIASRFLFRAGALVIMLRRSGLACPALTEHQGLTITSKQLGCQKIIVFRLVPCGSLFVFRKLFLYSIEKVFRDNRWDTVGNENLSVFIFTDVEAVLKQP